MSFSVLRMARIGQQFDALESRGCERCIVGFDGRGRIDDEHVRRWDVSVQRPPPKRPEPHAAYEVIPCRSIASRFIGGIPPACYQIARHQVSNFLNRRTPLMTSGGTKSRSTDFTVARFDP